VPFKAEHLPQIAPRLQPWQREMCEYFDRPGYADMLINDGEAYTMLADGVPIACAGVQEAWSNRGIAWALITVDAGKHMCALTRAVKTYLDDFAKWKRVEAYVDTRFPQGLRWIDILGFNIEGVMSNFTPDGADNFLCAKIRRPK
jgi:hypothetical protein